MYLLMAILDSDFGLDALVGLVVIQPIYACLIAIFTISFCLIIGLPIRLHKNLNNWWNEKWYVPILIGVIGIFFIALAFAPTFTETVTYYIDEVPTLKQIPNFYLALIGWMLTAFSMLHIYPLSIINVITKTIKKKFQIIRTT